MLLDRRGFLVAGAAVLLSGCAGTAKLAGPPPATTPPMLTPSNIANAINGTRKKFSAGPLSYSNALERAARNMANLMAAKNTISHTLGGTLRQRVNAVGYHGAVGENLAVGYNTLEGAITGWLDSPGHRSTLLSTKFYEFGLAAAAGKRGVFWAFIAGGDIAAWR